MNNYKTFAVPFSKVFLGAVLTYQIIYWTWLKLETDESKFEKNGTVSYFGDRFLCSFILTACLLEEMASLEKKARELAAAQK